MSIYPVYEPPLKAHESAPNPERFVFVRDGFSFWAFLLAPWWMLRHRLWLALTGFIIPPIALSGAPRFRGALFCCSRFLGGDVASLQAVTPRLEECGHRRRRRSRIGRAPLLRCLGQQIFGRQILGQQTVGRPIRGRRRAACILARNGRGDGAPAVIRGHRLVSATGSAAVTVAIVDYGSGNLHSASKA